MLQLSHPYMTTGKTIALTIRAFVSKVMSLLFNTLSRFVTGDGTLLQCSRLENPMDGGAWWAAVHGVTMNWTRLSDFTFTFHFHALEKAVATHSSVLAWRTPGTEEPGGLPSMGSQSRTGLKRLSSSSRLQLSFQEAVTFLFQGCKHQPQWFGAQEEGICRSLHLFSSCLPRSDRTAWRDLSGFTTEF